VGGKTSSSNSAVVKEQKAQAAEAKTKETARQTRLDTGLANIKAAFEGKKVTKDKSNVYDWSTYGSSVPAGYSKVKVDAAGNVYKQTTDNRGRTVTTDASGKAVTTDASGNIVSGKGRRARSTPTYDALQDSSGKTYKTGSALNYTTQEDTGQTTGGFDQAYYDKYRQGYVDSYAGQIADQYKKAQAQDTYDYARAGTSYSSAANQQIADRAKENAQAKQDVANAADTATGNQKNKIASEESKAISQLYATEDPTLATNTATTAVRDISNQKADTSALGDVFKAVTIGAANILKSGSNARAYSQFAGGLPKSSGSNY
jgi:hypothetical protein